MPYELPPDTAFTRRLAADLRAMRHLPPGTFLPRPKRPLERALFEDLLSLPDRVDPFRWLHAERSKPVAHLFLWSLLLQFKSLVVTAREQRIWGWLPSDDEQAAFGAFIPLAERDDPLAHLSESSEPDPDLLRHVLRRMREIRNSQPASQRSVQYGEGLGLVNQLLDLPNEVDPLNWVASERGHESAVWILRGVLMQCRPPAVPYIGSRVNNLPLSLHFSATDRQVEFFASLLSLAEGGFTMYLRLRAAIAPPPQSDRLKYLRIEWEGFDRVVDDHGYEYLLQHMYTSEPDTSQWVMLTFYPTVHLDAGYLVFSSTPLTLRVTGNLESGAPELANEMNLGDMAWRVELPRPRTDRAAP